MLKQQLSQKLSQKLSPQQIQLMKLIQLPTLAFEQKIKQELEENPALESGKEEEEDNFDDVDNSQDDEHEVIETEFDVDEYLSDDEIPSYKTYSNNYSADDDDNKVPYAAGKSFFDHLKSQIHTFRLDDEEEQIADFLIGSIDQAGYIRRDIEDIIDDLAFTQSLYVTKEKVLKVLKIVQRLDPAGVGAKDLKECLIIQLKRKKENKDVIVAKEILENAFDMFSKKHYEKLKQKFKLTDEELKAAIEQIEHLNPKPGASYSSRSKPVDQVTPDFTIRIKNDELELTLNSRNVPHMHISRDYNNMLKSYKENALKTKDQKKALLFIKQKLDSAKWFIDAIKQRQNTLISTMSCIMDIQREYFLTGDERNLKPMILKDVAEKIDMDISTVSRVANSKYVDTPYGTILIKDFFSESMKNDEGDDVSTREIKNILQSIIDKEDKQKPFTDSKLVDALKEKGYPIARRTVAKYREVLDIPVARLRKEL
ncbi:RNA polymerase factor sigma-54 [Flavobacteriaceae bacterium 14752]|uniref:RNA polymerase factor sigma-54 n=1 Tax=Mesohalobacter salilacus TaxID=2491711 RepID=UPI000F6434A6|nr:RNA polymerase sigma-54 factor [Flavobacteriaceae bacterium 14752]